MSPSITRAPVLVTLILVAGAALGQAPPSASPSDAALAEGVAALRANNYSAAERRFRSLTQPPVPAAQQAKALFYLGTMYQEQAERARDDATRARLLQQADASYGDALKRVPSSGPALNNRARVALALGNKTDALEDITQALALKDGRDSVYLRTQADILVQSGNPQQALEAALRAAEAAPADAGLRSRAVELALKGDAVQLVPFVDDLLSKGFVKSAEATLAAALAVPSQARIALGERLASVLAAQSYDPQTLPKGDLSGALSAMATDPTVAGCAQQLIGLHTAPLPDPRAYPWWTSEYRDYVRSKPGARDERFRALALSLGRWYRARASTSDLHQAEPYARLALALSGNSVDPQAVLLLADIYASTGEKDKLQQMSTQYVRALFAGKMQAYERADTKQIYAYHLALGSIFGYVGQWQNSKESSASAIYQLEHAKDAAQKLRGDSCKPPCGQLPVKAIDLLATGYEAVGRLDDSVKLRADMASEAISSAQPSRATEVLKAAEVQEKVTKLTPETRAKFEAARAKVMQSAPQ